MSEVHQQESGAGSVPSTLFAGLIVLFFFLSFSIPAIFKFCFSILFLIFFSSLRQKSLIYFGFVVISILLYSEFPKLLLKDKTFHCIYGAHRLTNSRWLEHHVVDSCRPRELWLQTVSILFTCCMHETHRVNESLPLDGHLQLAGYHCTKILLDVSKVAKSVALPAARFVVSLSITLSGTRGHEKLVMLFPCIGPCVEEMADPSIQSYHLNHWQFGRM